MSRIAIALLPFVLAMCVVPALAADRVAPLPEGIAPSGQPMIRGLYAEAEFGRIDVRDDLETLEADCKSRGVDPKVEGRDFLWKGKRRIYRGGTSVAVFEDTPTIKVDGKACSAVISLQRTVTAASGSWEKIRTTDWVAEPPTCAKVRRCVTTRVIAGVAAQCVDLGDGLVGSTMCFSQQEDLSKNLVLSSAHYSDDGSGPNNYWALDSVVTDALIDPAVFRDAP
jgi:hypothetical protein